MSIVTRRGDRGKTTLMYNRPVSKCHVRVEACGTVDELNAAIGLARAAAGTGPLRDKLVVIQRDLVVLMGELATSAEDLPRYVQDGHSPATSAMTAALEQWIGEIETGTAVGKGWALPGATTISAALDFARTVCRRAERRACAVQAAGQVHNPEITVYLNRLSDLLWLLARRAEAEAGH